MTPLLDKKTCEVYYIRDGLKEGRIQTLPMGGRSVVVSQISYNEGGMPNTMVIRFTLLHPSCANNLYLVALAEQLCPDGLEQINSFLKVQVVASEGGK